MGPLKRAILAGRPLGRPCEDGDVEDEKLKLRSGVDEPGRGCWSFAAAP